MRWVYQTYLITGYKYKDTTKFMLPYKLAVRPSQHKEQSQKSCKLKVKGDIYSPYGPFCQQWDSYPAGF